MNHPYLNLTFAVLVVMASLPLAGAQSVSESLGQETVPAGEGEAIERITQLIEQGVQEKAQDSGHAVRDAHAKHHGCVRAQFNVRSDVAPALQSGILKPGASYSAWIRFSNGSGNIQNDRKGDGRGMAIKLLGLRGPKLLDDEAATQDFLMINHPVFFVRNAQDYVGLTTVMSRGGILATLGYFLNPFHPHLHELKIAHAITSTPIENPLQSRYWSMTPYRWGNPAGPTAVKYAVRPCADTQTALFKGDSSSVDPLRQAMSRQLARTEACFDFYLQIQTDPAAEPIEDPTIEWEERISPPLAVARLVIPPQAFESDAQMRFCENLSFTPWHALPEHRPLGGINRARKAVYQAVSRKRHELNATLPVEPTGREQF